MANAATRLPVSDYAYGEDFNYSNWPKNSQITLVNVPWNTDYRDVNRFANRTALNTWIDAQPHVTVDNMSHLRFERNVRIDVAFTEALKYNYVRVTNGATPNGNTARAYYYFVQNVKYIAGDTTELLIQLDVFQTFIYDTEFGNVFMERGHVAIANTNAFNHYGRDYLTVPEGLDIGPEYRIVHAEREKIIDPGGDANIDPGYDVLVCSTLDLTQDPGDVSNPGLNSSKGAAFELMPSGASFYIFNTGNDFRTFLERYSTKPWITQSIISITLIPNASRYNGTTPFDYGPNLSTDPSFKFYSLSGKQLSAYPRKRKMLTGWRSNEFISNILGAKYGILKKFMTYPYMVLELTTWTGSPLLIKPESWQDPDAQVSEMAAFMPPGQRIAISPVRYNADGETTDEWTAEFGHSEDDMGEFLNFATFLDNFPSLPIVNNMAIGYLAANKNGIAFQQQSADWSQQKALAGAQATSDIASAGIGNTARQAAIGNTASTAQAALSATTGMNTAMVGLGTSLVGASPGGAAGVGLSAASGAGSAIARGMTANASLESAGIGNTARGQSALSSIQATDEIRDTNVDLARFAAQGDYANQIAGVNAKVQDAALIQPSVSGQFGGDAFNIIRGNFGYSLRWKMPNLNALRQIGDFWLRYGYAINQYGRMPADLACMSKFTYWKCRETYILSAPYPEQFKQAIRGIFEKGVTVWRNPNDIGRVALEDNVPLAGVSY